MMLTRTITARNALAKRDIIVQAEVHSEVTTLFDSKGSGKQNGPAIPNIGFPLGCCILRKCVRLRPPTNCWLGV
jgi:hypothetical protein